jgi:hypothetical protein
MRSTLLGPALVLLASFGPDFGRPDSAAGGEQISQKVAREEDDEKLYRAPAGLPAFINLDELKIVPTDSKLTQIYKLRQNAAQVAIESRFKEWVAGRGTQAFLIRSAEDLLSFRLDLAPSDLDKLAIRKQYVEFATVFEQLTRLRYESDKVPTQDLKQVEYFLLDAKIEQLRAADRIKKR